MLQCDWKRKGARFCAFWPWKLSTFNNRSLYILAFIHCNNFWVSVFSFLPKYLRPMTPYPSKFGLNIKPISVLTSFILDFRYSFDFKMTTLFSFWSHFTAHLIRALYTRDLREWDQKQQYRPICILWSQFAYSLHNFYDDLYRDLWKIQSPRKCQDATFLDLIFVGEGYFEELP